MSTLLDHKGKDHPDVVRKRLAKEKREKSLAENPYWKVKVGDWFAFARKMTEQSPPEPLSDEKEVSDTMELDTRNVPDELRNPQNHGGNTEVLVKRLQESREEE